MNTKIFTIGLSGIGVAIAAILCVNVLLFGGYNKHGISKYMNITIDESVSQTYVGEDGGNKIYMNNLSEAYFVTKDGKSITIQEAFATEKITLKDILSVCKKKKDGVYYAENYKIVLEETDYVISPKIKR